MPYNSNAHLLSIPLGKPPHFDGEDYSFWSHKMCSHRFSLHPSIWEIVENGMHFDSTDNPVIINEQIHKNAQATTMLLASLCRDEYNKVSGLDNAKQIWDTLKISHEGNEATMITKMELVEGELGRFAMIRGEEPTQTYNRLKTLVNKIRSYGSTRWMDHDVVRLMLRSFTVIDPHLVNLISENPRYTKMTPEEILGKFVSGRMMVKEARYVDDALNGPLPIYEPQPVALKATSSKEALPSKVAQVEAIGLNGEEMALIIKRFKTTLKGRKEYPNKNKTRGKRFCFKCGKTGHFTAQCPDNDNDQAQEKHGKREKKNYRKAKGEAHIGKEWDSNCSSSDSKDEGLAASAFNKSSLFPNERHTCLMDKEKKVRIRDTPKYSSSSDEESSDDEVDYSGLFKGLNRAKVEKINELIDALNEKDGLLEKQEDILYEEHDKFVTVQKSLALEIKRNEMLSSELSACHESVSSLKNLNDELNAKLDEVSKTSSCVEHVIICNRCKDFDSDSKDEGLAASAFNKSSLFPNERHTCLMDKEKKVRIRDTPKYSSSSDEESSDDEVDYSGLFKGLNRAKVEKINELIDALNEKDGLLEKQEDILYEEHDKFVTVQKSLALEIKRNEMLSSELSTCHESVSSLKNLNDELNGKLEEVSKTSSCVEHVIICNRCKDFDVDACNEHLISIAKLNNEVASLNAQLKTCKVDFDKLKFARDTYTIGRHLSIKDGLGF
jgi:ACT domain-containing protein